MSFLVIYITNPDKRTANEVSSHLLDKKLIACSNIFPIQSAYWWKGSIENEDEYVAIVKTSTEMWQQIIDEVTRIHPYETPCIMKFEVEANIDYETWIHNEIKKPE